MLFLIYTNYIDYYIIRISYLFFIINRNYTLMQLLNIMKLCETKKIKLE